ncbi:hypothetical protein ABB37_00109 [Leptomonas pyrrhocoris]|uniref:CRAL-TRIO domain-containing protein n=1 Tax=Leptomonas pyrrhocoris TaxID=157538 RepID=A0A0M9G9U4_LEPPY|nr:hypothetical protein ABB37_00109 [Leptomonas pyrrhocoris]XP_015664187.1 hypothetical protein ABB37_00109 [Leptomonas pyrrhocoris]KPA85747.1 hypothetical protein ABB37_00109 [Leptomonas pyrrhocoris]KPA85748.1 hypothetical protein ABB37_00109 [Leptomonas pyrrhocoris]|eukprot:XP_015664186.1 hypothetical protein ABB37_00109 [Leptomonas pyrrhocoris]
MSAEQQRLNKIHREAVILAEAKAALGLSADPSAASRATSPTPASNGAPKHAAAAAATAAPEDVNAARELYEQYGLSTTAVNAYLLRYLRSKHLSVDEALAKLRRRRVFERTLPTISITQTTVAALRSGALHLLGNDLEGRPILYVNMSAFTLPTLELDEAQRLLVILLEFMQAQCLLKNNEDDTQARQQRVVAAAAAAAAASGKQTIAQSVQEAEKEATCHLQQFTLLINEEGAPWGSHESFLRNSGTFFSMFPKYYPMMLGTVLVLGASFEIRMAIKACVGNSPDDVRDAVRMIERPDLARFIDLHTIPIELGGQKQVTGSAMNFSEAVLRHWFTLTSQMEEENAFPPSSATSVTAAAAAGGGDRVGAESDEEHERRARYQRPLYVPPPPLGTTQQLISRQRQTIELQHLSGVVGGDAPAAKEGRNRTVSQHRDVQKRLFAGGASMKSAKGAAVDGDNNSFLSLSGGRRGRKGDAAARPRGDENGDDGVCSELSGVDDEEGDEEEDGGQQAMHVIDYARDQSGSFFTMNGVTTNQVFTAASMSGVNEGETDFNNTFSGGGGAAGATAGGAVTPEEVSRYTASPEAAIAALRRERQRREQVEQALQFRDLGVTLDLRNASTIEKELAALHQDLNVLVAEVLVKADAARKRQSTPPTLNQLLDLTLTAFEGATSTPTTMPAMVLAQPCQRDATSFSCCNFM